MAGVRFSLRTLLLLTTATAILVAISGHYTALQVFFGLILLACLGVMAAELITGKRYPGFQIGVILVLLAIFFLVLLQFVLR